MCQLKHHGRIWYERYVLLQAGHFWDPLLVHKSFIAFLILRGPRQRRQIFWFAWKSSRVKSIKSPSVKFVNCPLDAVSRPCLRFVRHPELQDEAFQTKVYSGSMFVRVGLQWPSYVFCSCAIECWNWWRICNVRHCFDGRYTCELCWWGIDENSLYQW